MKTVPERRKINFTDVILLASLTLVGCFHEFVSCLLSAAMSAYLLIRLARGHSFRLHKSFFTLAVVMVSAGYAVTCLWAIDPGMAFIGFLKFSPLVLYLLCLWQEDSSNALDILPYYGVAMTVISAIAMQFPLGEKLFSVVGRLAGFFQYSNTFALFALVCELLLLKKPKRRWWDYVCIPVLIAGLLYSGSRTVFVLFVLSNIAMLFTVSRKRFRAVLLIILGAGVVLAGILFLTDHWIIRRFLSISLTQSTFVGRILYAADALPLLLKYPFGMGYMGYNYMQDSIQTGLYHVTYVHNDFLQLLLDIGLIPAGIFLAALVRWFAKKTVPLADKIVASVICLHSLFDFDLQFVSIFMLLILVMFEKNTEKMITVRKKSLTPWKICFAAAALVCLYMSIPLALSNFGLYRASENLYAFNTENKINILENTQDISEAERLANEILQQNKHSYVPYTVKALSAYQRGDLETVITCYHTIFEMNPFRYDTYRDYCIMLISGISSYQRQGDTQSMQICIDELLTTYKLLDGRKDRLSPLGKMIDTQPATVLPDDIQQYIDHLLADQ